MLSAESPLQPPLTALTAVQVRAVMARCIGGYAVVSTVGGTLTLTLALAPTLTLTLTLTTTLTRLGPRPIRRTLRRRRRRLVSRRRG